MRSLVCREPGALALEERPKPVRQGDEVLIRIRRVGICGTDMHIFRGRQPYLSYPRVMGHEFAGEVEDAPAGGRFQPGDRVAVMPYFSCGDCVACRTGKTNCCVELEVLGVHRDGALADYVSVPERFVMSAEGLTLDQAAMIEFLAIGAHAVRRTAVKTDEKVLVVGAGPIGLGAALFARLRGARVWVVDSREDRLAFAARTIGVEQVVALSPQTASQLSDQTGGEFFDVVFDATGNPAAMQTGFGYVAHGGRYGLISVVSADITFSDPEFHKREITLLACRNATQEDFDTVVDAIRGGQAPTEAFASHRALLEDLPTILPAWIEPESHVIKALIEV